MLNVYKKTTMAEKKPEPVAKPDPQYQKVFTLLKALEQKVNNLNREVELSKVNISENFPR